VQNKIEQIVVGDIGTNCWLYAMDDEPPLPGIPSGKRPCVAIDPGDEAGLIVSRIREFGWFPVYILLTHGHFDHLAALSDLFETFRAEGNGAYPQIGIHRLDAGYLGSSATGHPAYLKGIMKPLPDADFLFEEGDTIGPLSVLHVPGHTPGGVCFYDEKAGILFSGDTLFRRDYGRTDLAGGNWEKLHMSLQRLLSMPGEIIVCPGHGQKTTIKEEAEELVIDGP